MRRWESQRSAVFGCKHADGAPRDRSSTRREARGRRSYGAEAPRERLIASNARSGPIPLRWRIFGLGSVLRPQRSLEKGPVIGDCSVELRLAISSHAQDEPETDRFFFGYLPFLLSEYVKIL